MNTQSGSYGTQSSSYGSQSGSSQSGYGQSGYGYGQGGQMVPGGQVVRVQNRTIVYDQNHNIVSQTETSTEYGSILGHEGEEGSSFNK